MQVLMAIWSHILSYYKVYDAFWNDEVMLKWLEPNEGQLELNGSMKTYKTF